MKTEAALSISKHHILIRHKFENSYVSKFIKHTILKGKIEVLISFFLDTDLGREFMYYKFKTLMPVPIDIKGFPPIKFSTKRLSIQNLGKLPKRPHGLRA